MRILFTVSFAFIVGIIGNAALVAQDTMKPPIAKKVPKVLKIHGYEITDNYSWMRDRNSRGMRSRVWASVVAAL